MLHPVAGISVCHHLKKVANSTLKQEFPIRETGGCELLRQCRGSLVPLGNSPVNGVQYHDIRELQIIKRLIGLC